MKNFSKRAFTLFLVLALVFVSAPLTGLKLTAEAKSSSGGSVISLFCKHRKTKTTIKAATFSKNGSEICKCARCGKVIYKEVILKIASVKLDKAELTYTGKSLKPSVTVKDSKGLALDEDLHYTVTYKNNKAPGKATATVTFKNGYKGTKTLSFKIIPALSVKRGSSSLTLSWTKVKKAASYKASLYDGKKLVKAVNTKKPGAKFTGLSKSKTYKLVIKVLDKDKKTLLSASYPIMMQLNAGLTKAQIVEKYAKVYNTTKKNGKFIGYDAANVRTFKINDKENNVVRNVIDKVLVTGAENMQLPPYSDKNPAKKCLVTAAEIKTATYTDNADGTATIKLVPKTVKNPKRFKDAQGKMFNVGEISNENLDNIPLINWTQGDAKSNISVVCGGGYAEITYNKQTNRMTKADYTLVSTISLKHANILVFEDATAVMTYDYKMLFPSNSR